MTQRDYIIKLITPVIVQGMNEYKPQGKPVDEISSKIVDKLIEEGVINAHYGSQEIGAVVEAFKNALGTTAVSRYDRFAAKRLTDKHGVESIVTAIKLLAQFSDRQYAPTINSVSELERKWVSVVKFINGQRTEEITEL